VADPPFGDLDSRVGMRIHLPHPGDYTGMFSNPGYGDMTVESIGGNLYLTYYRLRWPLSPTSSDSFEFVLHAFGGIFNNRTVKFSRNTDGKVEKLIVVFEKQQVGPIEFVKR